MPRGETVRYLLFWGHTPRSDGTIGRSCLSQWWPAPFAVGGVEYATAEHWKMAGRERLFGDAEAERAVLTAPNPALARKAGRLVRGFDEEVWERERLGTVAEGSTHKVGQDPRLRAYLLATAGRVLVEASPVDLIRGIGPADDDERAKDPARWRGLKSPGLRADGGPGAAAQRLTNVIGPSTQWCWGASTTRDVANGSPPSSKVLSSVCSAFVAK
jgi:ribA/ribD-fused uncharacterized protein